MPTTLADVRALALTLPRTTEGQVRGRTKCYVGRIVYMALARDETAEIEKLVTEAWSMVVPQRVVDEWMASRASS